MPVFTFSGKNASGEKVSGERSAPNKQVLQSQLRRERITPGAIREKGKEFALPTFGSGKVKVKEIAIFFRQFSVMIDAGLPLVQCLEILAANQENPAFQKTLTGVRTTVEGGATLANAMKQYPKVFDDLTTNMIEAGETGGILVVILQRLAIYVEKAVKLKTAVARFTRTLGTLITSGVPILEGLSITARTSGNAVLEEALMKVRKAIEEGRTIVDPLRESGVFPNMVTQMIGVGEATGAMDAMLQKIADFYEDEVDAATKDMLAMLEPVIIGLLGIMIGGIVISLYMPLFSMIAKLAG